MEALIFLVQKILSLVILSQCSASPSSNMMLGYAMSTAAKGSMVLALFVGVKILQTGVNCGMGASTDSKTCTQVIFDQVTSVGALALNVVSFGVSGAANVV